MSGPSEGVSSKWSRPVLGGQKAADKASNPNDAPQKPKISDVLQKVKFSEAPEKGKHDDDERTEVSSVDELMKILGDSESWDDVESNFKSEDAGSLSLNSLETNAVSREDAIPVPAANQLSSKQNMIVDPNPPSPPVIPPSVPSMPAATLAPEDGYLAPTDAAPSIVMSLQQANLAGMMQKQPPAPKPVAVPLDHGEMASVLDLMSPTERRAYEDELREMIDAGMTGEERMAFEEEKRAEIFAELTPSERQAFEEQQRQKALAAMTPQQREAQFARDIDRERQERLEREAKQREFADTYAISAGAAPKKSAPIGMIAGVLGTIIFLAILFVFLFSSPKEEGDAALKDAVVQVELPPAAVVAEALKYAPVKINVLPTAILFVNGVKVDPTAEHQFVVGKSNSIIAYYDGMLPHFKTFDVEAFPTQAIEINFESDILYNKASVSFALSDPNIETYDMKATVDGKNLNQFPSVIADLAMGRPHILTLQKPGFAKHMHVFWLSDRKDNVVTIPALATEYNAVSGTTCDIKKFPMSAKPYSLRIKSGENTYSSPTLVTVPKGGMIEYTVARDQRETLRLAIYPEGLGTLSIDSDLLVKSIGDATVNFSAPKKSDVQVCLRRIGEVICPPMGTDTLVPSGLGWEVLGYTGGQGNMTLLRNIYSQDLQSTKGYKFLIDADSRGSFSMKLESSNRMK